MTDAEYPHAFSRDKDPFNVCVSHDRFFILKTVTTCFCLINFCITFLKEKSSGMLTFLPRLQILEIRWLRKDDYPSDAKKWYRYIDIVENTPKMDNAVVVESSTDKANNPSSTVTYSKPKYRYTLPELMELGKSPLSNIRPDVLQKFKVIDKTAEKSEPEKQQEVKKPVKKQVAFRIAEQVSESREKKNKNKEIATTSNSKNVTSEENSKSLLDSKERLKKEADVVLSPQRRSFNSGCSVVSRKMDTDNTILLNKHDVRDKITRRIVNSRLGGHQDSWECPDYLGGDTQRGRNIVFGDRGEIPSIVFERRFDLFDKSQGDKRRVQFFGGNDRYRQTDNMRNGNFNQEEEPEWMKDGHVTMNDTIELRGFDEEKDGQRKLKATKADLRIVRKSGTSVTQKTTAQKDRESAKEQNSSQIKGSSVSSLSSSSSSSEEQISLKKDTRKETTQKQQPENDADSVTNSEIKQSEDKTTVDKRISSVNSINLEELLKTDIWPEGVPAPQTGESRFKKFFKQDSVPEDPSIADIKMNFKDSSKQNSISKDATKDSPKAFSHHIPVQDLEHEVGRSLLNILHSGTETKSISSTSLMQEVSASPSAGMSGIVHSLEEIETMLKGGKNAAQNVSAAKQPEDKKKLDIETFTLMLKKANEQRSAGPLDSLAISAGIAQAQASLNSNNAGQLPHNMTGFYGMRQTPQQQAAFVGMLSAASAASKPNNVILSQPQPPVMSHINVPGVLNLPENIQALVNVTYPTPEILQRKEAQEMMKALSIGALSHTQLVEELMRTTSQNREFRESIICILKMMQLQALYGPPVPNSGIPSMHIAIFNTNTNQANSAAGNRLQQGMSSILNRPIAKTGLLHPVCVEEMRIPLSKLDPSDTSSHKGATSVPSSTALTVTSSSTKAATNKIMEQEKTGDKLLAPIDLPPENRVPPPVLWKVTALEESSPMVAVRKSSVPTPVSTVPTSVPVSRNDSASVSRPPTSFPSHVPPQHPHVPPSDWSAPKSIQGLPMGSLPRGVPMPPHPYRGLTQIPQHMPFNPHFMIGQPLRKPPPAHFVGYTPFHMQPQSHGLRRSQPPGVLPPANKEDMPARPGTPMNRFLPEMFSNIAPGQLSTIPNPPRCILSVEEVEKLQRSNVNKT